MKKVCREPNTPNNKVLDGNNSQELTCNFKTLKTRSKILVDEKIYKITKWKFFTYLRPF